MFEFGKNWKAFSETALSAETIQEAERSLRTLLDCDALRGQTFLDIGSGSGLFSIAAARLGATPVTGVDVDPLCVEVAKRNAAIWCSGCTSPAFQQLSILDDSRVHALPAADIVYAWGSLHHTGDMATAIRNAAGRVAPGGRFVLAIYNRHWTSPAWTVIKRTYNASPTLVRRIMVYGFTVVIYAAKFAVTRRNPFRQKRGMNFFYNVVDWIGGYPYEYASVKQIINMLESLGFKNLKTVHTEVPTGCNEFVFETPTH